jgi:hypothetical protein
MRGVGGLRKVSKCLTTQQEGGRAHQHFDMYRPRHIISKLYFRQPHTQMVYKLQEALTFSRSNLIFPAPGSTSNTKKCGNIQKKSTKANPTPLPCLPAILPHEVTQDSPFNVLDTDHLPFVPDTSFGDWMAANTVMIVTMSGCKENCLKECIVAALASIWVIQDMFLAQLDAVFQLLHPIHQNHLAVIQQTGAGKTHILWMLGVIERGIVLIFTPLLTLLTRVMLKFKCANQHFGANIIQHLDKLYDANKQTYNNSL